MPLLSIAIDQTLWQEKKDQILAALPGIRDMLCAKLSVGQEISSLTVVPVFGLPDQILVNGDLRVLDKADRGNDVLHDVATTLQQMLTLATNAHSSVRITSMDPDKYFAKR